MKSLQQSFLTVLFTVFAIGISNAQCPNNNSNYGFISSLSPGQTQTVFCMYGGERATVNVVS